MTTTELRRRASRRLKDLSPDRLRVADDFLAYLQDAEDNAATRELLQVPGLRQALERADRQIAAGQTVPLSRIRRGV